MKFRDFLDDLANDQLAPLFVRKLITTPNNEDNYYFNYGDRWCSVESLLSTSPETLELLKNFAFCQLDPDYHFSSGNLKAQYIPDEDFINDGSAIVIFSLVGSQWLHTVRISNQNKLFDEL
ncbi:hypothetical protein [Vibrio parahaemolyticus]|uniref:hypothetical protein n=1 Tax=Vibrio parahaemolyticus TaxID=670 RepID=UPI00111E60A8|nr:hypothetical protein [Vibrio parahaemolyticus]ELA9326206.1 hypothetical protein [Vibrio parahaemolyticus]ELB2244988.1 hypothetical protein [Vibrio parahaemolyticus]TOF46923.1 hypothetical protein CGJ22_23380 [Vibrio parahaemolyticus]HCE2149510.1 hypothetical protein [Vibrio parahaemolyticus]